MQIGRMHLLIFVIAQKAMVMRAYIRGSCCSHTQNMYFEIKVKMHAIDTINMTNSKVLIIINKFKCKIKIP